MQQHTPRNNQTPHDNQPSNQLLKDKQRKKVSNGLMETYGCLIQYVFTHHQLSCFKQAQHENNQSHITISRLLNQKLLDGVEEVSFVAHKL